MKNRRLVSALALCVMLVMVITATSAPVASAASQQAIYTGPRLAAEPEGARPSLEDINHANNLPISDGSLTLTIFQSLTSTVTSLDMGKNQFTDILSKATGINLQFVTAPASDATTKLNLLLSSGDYPDIISNNILGLNGMALYASQGVFVPLDAYIDKWGVNTKAVLERYPGVRALITASDGMIYSLPNINDCYHCLRGEGRNWYYRPWIDSLNGGKIPQTAAEFEDYLIKIRDGDPNGNGKKDEVPLAFRKDDIWFAINWAANFFQKFPAKGWANVDGKITPLYVDEQFRQTLKWLNELYSQGLILKDAFSITGDDLIAIGEDPAGATLGNIVGWGPEAGTKKAGDSKRWFEYFVMPPVAGPAGERNTVFNPNSVYGNGWFVTDKCQDPEAATRLGDVLLDEYYGYSSYIGPEGQSWTYASPGDIALNGKPAVFKELVTYGAQPENCSWDQTNITFRPDNFRLSQYAEGVDTIYKYFDNPFDAGLRDQAAALPSYNEIMKYYGSQKSLSPYQIDAKYVIPPLLYSDADASEVADIEAVIDPYLLQMFAAFVTGQENLDAGFDKYVSDLNQMGLDRLTAAKQRAYDAYAASIN